MYKILLILNFLVLVNFSFGQNLVPNGNFEDKKRHRYTHRPWRFINTVDRYVHDGKSRMPLGTSKWNLPKPKEGDVYIGLRIYTQYREFIQIKLSNKLQRGKRYYFEMYVRASDDVNCYTKQLGASFYNKRPAYTSRHFIFTNPPQINYFNNKGIVQSDTIPWVKISGVYKAKGGERYLSIGNFSKERLKDRMRKKKWYIPDYWKMRAYYYVDDISLYELNDFKPKEDPITMIDTTIHLVDSTYDIIKENYIYKIESDKKLTLEKIRFESGSDKLLYNSFQELELVLEYLNENRDVSLKIVGHTDNIGSDAANLKLSTRRAKTVYDYFISNRINKSRLQFEGKGESEPIESNESSSGRSKNRRVEIKIIEKALSEN